MKVVLQRAERASVEVLDEDGSSTGDRRSIGPGLLVLLGIGPEDGESDCDYLVRKISNLRIFRDDAGKMNLSVKDTDGQVLVVSQFTLYGDTKKGNRPSFNGSAPAEMAVPLYRTFLKKLESALGQPVPAGEFGAYMKVDLVNDGPVTIIMDSR